MFAVSGLFFFPVEDDNGNDVVEEEGAPVAARSPGGGDWVGVD